jgi:aldose 1-epimerase
MEIAPYGTLSVPDGAGRSVVEGVAFESPELGVALVTYGATLLEVTAPDRHGRHEAVCLAPHDLAELERIGPTTYLGATCGRWAGRIAGAHYDLDGRTVALAANDGDAQLHGGPDGFSQRVWALVEAASTPSGGRVTMTLDSPDGDQGHPGAVHATATYELDGPTLRITYEATADAPSAINLTNHAYWNLAGPAGWAIPGSVGDHLLRVDADEVLPVGRDGIPTGPPTTVDGTPFDLRAPRRLDEVLAATDAAGQVLDTPFARRGAGLAVAAELTHPASGRRLVIRTDQPSIHAYAAGHLRAPFAPRAAICLEAQRFPDAPNRPELGPALVRPGETYRSITELTFDTTA